LANLCNGKHQVGGFEFGVSSFGFGHLHAPGVVADVTALKSYRWFSMEKKASGSHEKVAGEKAVIHHGRRIAAAK